MKRRKVEIAHDTTGETFSRLHERGAREYPQHWLSVNNAVVAQAGYRCTPSDPAMKELLSGIILTVLDRLKCDGFLRTKSAR